MRLRRPMGIGVFAIGALVVAVLLAALASPFASTHPDGLNKVAFDEGFDAHAKDSAVADGPLAGYAVTNVRDEKVSKGLSGVIGVGVTVVVAGLLFGGMWMLVRRRTNTPAPTPG